MNRTKKPEFLHEIAVHLINPRRTCGLLSAGSQHFVCAIGRAGVSWRKREGDGATPAGNFLLRRLFFRPDRLARPRSGLPAIALAPETAWCEDAASALYNRQVRVSTTSGLDRMWRDDHLYDIVIEIGYNDDPVIKGRGSAIFLHLARPGYAPTAGCVALARPDMLRLLPRLGPETRICIG